jgi:hypothetical protein
MIMVHREFILYLLFIFHFLSSSLLPTFIGFSIPYDHFEHQF